MCMAGLHRYTDCIPTMKMRALYSISSAFLTCIPMITQELITSVIICIYLMEHEAYTHTGLRTMNNSSLRGYKKDYSILHAAGTYCCLKP